MTVTLFIKHDYKNSSPYFKPELYATLDYAVQYCLINKMQGHLYNKPLPFPKKLVEGAFRMNTLLKHKTSFSSEIPCPYFFQFIIVF